MHVTFIFILILSLIWLLFKILASTYFYFETIFVFPIFVSHISNSVLYIILYIIFSSLFLLYFFFIRWYARQNMFSVQLYLLNDANVFFISKMIIYMFTIIHSHLIIVVPLREQTNARVIDKSIHRRDILVKSRSDNRSENSFGRANLHLSSLS